MGEDRHFFTTYSTCGRRLDLEAILRLAKPVSKYSSWRRGEPDPVGGKTVTSGIMMLVFAGGSEHAFRRAIERFVIRESRLLTAVRRVASPGASSELSTSLFIADGRVQPLGIELPSDLLRRLGTAGVTWRVGAIPTYEDGTYKLGESRPALR
jgi:hypothetical protein